MTGFTPGDLLPYPDDYDQPADSPNALEALAQATQAGLNRRAALAPSAAGVTYATGWRARAPGLSLQRFGSFVVARGMATVTANLTVADNGSYTVCTLPVGFRPPIDVYAAAAWSALNGPSRQRMSTQVVIAATGAVSLISNVDGSMVPDGDWVSLGGVVWSTV